MAFRLTEFAGETLPTYNGIWDFSTPFLPSTLISTINGSADFYGTRRRIQHNQMFEVDMWGDAVTVATMADQVRELKMLTGRTGWLHRVERGGGSELRRYCRLLGVGITPRATESGMINKLTMRFESNQPFWYSETLTTHGPTAISSGGNINLTVAGEEDVIDAVLTITATSSISSITVEHSKSENGETINSEMDYTDTLSNTHELEIDCGAYTVKDDGSDAYDGFALDSTHNEEYWLRLPAGAQTLVITLGSGSGTYQLDYYAAYQ